MPFSNQCGTDYPGRAKPIFYQFKNIKSKTICSVGKGRPSIRQGSMKFGHSGNAGTI